MSSTLDILNYSGTGYLLYQFNEDDFSLSFDCYSFSLQALIKEKIF